MTSTVGNDHRTKPRRARPFSLSEIDRKLLKALLAPNGRVSSKALSEKLGIPETTVQRRRKRLESEILSVNYALDIDKFGWHKVDFFIVSEKGKTTSVARQLLKNDQIVFVGRSIGEKSVDLHVQSILHGNGDILQMMDMIRAIDGVSDVSWSEVVEVVSRKSSVPHSIIDRL